MLITCEHCKTRYNLSDKADTPPIFKVRCSKCNHVFTVQKSEAEKPLLLNEDAVVPTGPKVISICNQKGGVAKTTTVLNLGMSLAMQNKRVLLVDFDMQASLSITLGLSNQEKSFYDLVHVPENKFSDVIQKTKYQNLWILPSNPNMALLTKKNINQKNFEHILRDRLDSIKKNIDHIIIDTPPSIELFTLNALVASDLVIIPTQCEYLSMHGVAHIEEAINTIKRIQNKELDYRILFTMFNPESTASKVIHNKIKTKYQGKVFDTIIEFDTKVQESQIMNSSVIDYDDNSLSARQYLNLAQEMTGSVS